MTAPFLAILMLIFALLLPTTCPFYISTHFVKRHDASRFIFQMAKIKELPSAEQRTRRRYNTWARMIRRLEEYHAQYGHSQVSPLIDPQLHKWARRIRYNYRHQIRDPSSTRGPRLSPDKLDALERLDFPWSEQEDSWRKRYKELCEFHAQHGHCRVPMDGDTKRLAVWANNQRRFYRNFCQGQNTTLTQERIDMLEKLSFFDDFQTYQDIWDLRMEELREFYNLHNHSNVPADYEENYSLGQWVMNLRTQYKRYLAGLPSILTPSRITALEGLDFRWNMDAYKWFRMLERLKQHYSQHDGSLENLDYDLHIWVITQRHLYHRKLQNRTSPLTEKRIQALEAIPGFEWRGRAAPNQGPTVDDWTKLFEGIRQKGISPDIPPKQHWFEGQSREFELDTKEVWTEEDLLALWNQEE